MRLRMPINERSSRAPVAPGCPDIACFDRHDGQRRRVQQISQLVREKSQPFIQRLDVLAFQQRMALKSVFRHGIGDAIVETAVESSKLIDRDRHAPFKCQIRYGLAQIAIVVNHLVNRESLF